MISLVPSGAALPEGKLHMQANTRTTPERQVKAPSRSAFPAVQMRFVAIWIALVLLFAIGAVFLPRSVNIETMLAIMPFAAFLAIAAMGQSIVLMGRGIDLSVPAIVTLSSTLLLGVSGGRDETLVVAILVALGAAMAVGAINGILVAVLKLNSLIVTLAIGAVVSGLTLWYRQGLPAESKVPLGLAELGGGRLLGIGWAIWIAAAIAIAGNIVLRRTLAGRRFEAVGANPRAAHAVGIETMRYQAGSFVAAALLYGTMGILLSGFIRNPTLEVGAPYLLAPIAAAVLGGTAISGGFGNMISVAGAAIFLVQLDQMLKMLGLATSYQMIIQGCAIALGMWLSGLGGRRRLGS
jgi:ribose transport system permease protein